MKKTQFYITIFSLFALVLSGCSNPFLDKPQSRPEQETASPDIPEGFGAIRVNFSQGAARTVMPAADLAALHLEYHFAKDGGTAEIKTPDGDDKFVLEPGTYSLEVKAFADNAHANLAAQGTADATFTIAAGVEAGAVNVTLHPVASGEGAGSLQFGLQYPAGTTVETLTLTRIAGDEGPINLKAVGTAYGGVIFSGTKTDIPVGYYILRVRLRNSAGEYAGKSEVVHIYQNLTAQTALEEYTFTADDFGAILVTNANDAGMGSLRQAVGEANALGGAIRVMLPPGSVIELQSVLPQITNSVTIEGNGIILTRAASWTGSNDDSQLFRIGNAGVVTVRRIHFKNGLATNYGGAIRNFGNLTLESCIFSGNRITAGAAVGGAVSSGNTLTIRGCTFYGNTTGGSGGAVDFSGLALTLEGNLFYGNTAGSGYPAVYNAGSGTVSASYNVVDAASGTGTTDCGWTGGTGDTHSITDLPVSPKTFRVLDGSDAAGKLTALPGDYPTVDFYGDTISAGGAAGAVQAATENQSGYYYLDLSVNNSLRGIVSANPTPDDDGLYPAGSLAITATPYTGYVFSYWLVDEVETAAPPASLSAHTVVQAVFYPVVTVFADGTNSATAAGTLRYALTNALDGDNISFSGATPGTTVIELESSLPEITKNITIEGTGITLTRAVSWTGSDTTSQLLRITNSGGMVIIRGIHFKNGLANNYGGAIDNRGTLTLESCIFNDNRTTASNANGGAVYSNNALTIRGSTFYGNTTNGYGGAVYFDASGKTLTLTGNVFHRNTAGNSYPVVRNNGTVNASDNVADVTLGTGNTESGWTAGSGDIYSPDLPVSPRTFKVLFGSPAAGKLPATLSADYPATDFYGQPINGGGAAGAVQELTASGYSYLEFSVNNSLAGSIASVTPAPNEDGLVPNGSVTLTADPAGPSCSFEHWLVNGAVAATTNPYTLPISGHTQIQAVFSRLVTVNSAGDSGNGTLREALSNAQDRDTISLSGVTPGTTTIELESPLPEITKNITIEGNGATLTRAASWTGSSDASQLLSVNGAAVATVRRIHFKNGLANNYGGAIRNLGNLTLESCVFSGNRTLGGVGGAISSANTLTIRGCTFYGNTTGGSGGAVDFSGSTLTLEGNLFFGNTAASGYPALYKTGSGTVSASYNVADADFGTGNTQCGWTAGTGDVYSAAPFVTHGTFKALHGSSATARLPSSLPAGYPATDFYGQAVSGGGAAGAVQTVTAGGYYYLDLSVNNDQRGTVSVNATPDADGLYSGGSLAFTASPSPGYYLEHWLVNGSVVTPTVNPYTMTISGHAQIQAVFYLKVDTFSDGAGAPGTLRYALTNALDGDIIRLSGVTPGTTVIELESALPELTKSVTIEGNGVILTRAPSWTSVSYNTQLLRITNSGAEVTIRRVHFKNGLSAGRGGAIWHDGTLTLESCIFSNNRTTTSNSGGAVYSSNTLTIRACTFYGNTAGYSSGAVYFFLNTVKTLTLEGNLFYGNSAGNGYPVVQRNRPYSASYNVVDVGFGTGSTQCGWPAGTGDFYSPDLPISPKTFKVFPGGPAAGKLTALPADYPDKDFYGQPISAGGAAGAVQASTTNGSGYYYLDLSVHKLRGTISTSPAPDADGLIHGGSVTFTASPYPGYASFTHWLVDDVVASTSNPATMTISNHSRIQAVFSGIVVNTFTDEAGSATTPGTLRYALTNMDDDDTIYFSGVTPGATGILLESPLPEITKSITLEGNGVILARDPSWTAVSYNTQLLRIGGSDKEVRISGVFFFGGQATSDGGAIYSNITADGTLTLESCIFLGNQIMSNWASSANGGAVCSYNTLTIRGCTFDMNALGSFGAQTGSAVCVIGSTLTLTGNLFYRNTTASRTYHRVVYAGGTINASYNVVDVAFGTGDTQCGWPAGPGDKTTLSDSDDLSISGAPFNTTSFVPVSGLSSILPGTAPADFPTTDFYGNPRTFPGAPGAVNYTP